MGLLVGVVASLVLAAVLIVVVLRMRGRGESHDEKDEPGRREKPATTGGVAAAKDDNLPDAGSNNPDDNNPDLIPDKSGESWTAGPLDQFSKIGARLSLITTGFSFFLSHFLNFFFEALVVRACR